MPTFRDIVVFFAGAEAFHTIAHIMIALSVNLPLQTKYLTLTSTMNSWSIVINGALTLVLLWLARMLAK